MLKENKLYAKLSKCEFLLKEVSFLSHVISSGGIIVDPSKVDAVLQWEALKSVTLAKIYSNVSDTRTYNRVAIKLYLFLKERKNIDKTRGKKIFWVRSSVMQGKCISTPNVYGTPWEPF